MMVMNIELTELGRHEAWLRLSNIVKAGDSHVQLERKLASELIRIWRECYESALKELFKKIPEDISPQAVGIITKGLDNALGSAFGSSQSVSEELKKYITKAYESGKSEFVAKSDLKLPDKRAIEVLTKHNCFWLGEHYGKRIGKKIASLTQNAIEDGLGRTELAKELREALGGKVGGYKYWDVVSSAALVRSRSFGCISGMVEAGITEYEILAMGDERMCPICGEMNGRTFSVTATQKVIDRALGISNPEEFKEAMPWHTQPPTDVSKDKLVANGMSIPPFHGRCRCTLVMSESVEATEPDKSVEPDKPAEMIRGVSQDEIDNQRGLRGHAEAGSITAEEIMNDYKRVGINIDMKEAQKIHSAIQNFTGTGYSSMHNVYLKFLKGKSYPEGTSGYKLLEQFKLCSEYTKIAPTYQGVGQEIFRGVRNAAGDRYSHMLLGLKPGDEFNLQMPSSFSSDKLQARGFAGLGGILFHVDDTDIKNAPSISGVSVSPHEKEILVNDQLWEVVKVDDQRHAPGVLYEPGKDGLYHIMLKRKEG